MKSVRGRRKDVGFFLAVVGDAFCQSLIRCIWLKETGHDPPQEAEEGQAVSCAFCRKPLCKAPPATDLRALSPLRWVEEERRRQDERWGEQNHTQEKWYAILGEEFGEVGRAINEASHTDYKNLREELVQVAAVAIAAVECLDREQTKRDSRTLSGVPSD